MNNNPDCHPETPESGQQTCKTCIHFQPTRDGLGICWTRHTLDSVVTANSPSCDEHRYMRPSENQRLHQPMPITNAILIDLLDERDVAKDRTHHLTAAYYAAKYGDYKNALYHLDMLDLGEERGIRAQRIYAAINQAATIVHKPKDDN